MVVGGVVLENKAGGPKLGCKYYSPKTLKNYVQHHSAVTTHWPCLFEAGGMGGLDEVVSVEPDCGADGTIIGWMCWKALARLHAGPARLQPAQL